jgi:hypothetical protein
MKCDGAGKAPRSLYKAIRHYELRDGRPWFNTGWGECNHCRGAYCVRPVRGAAVMVHHKPISECTVKEQRLNLRRKQHWITYYNQNHITGGTLGNFGGQIGQYFNVVEAPAWTMSSSTFSNQTYYSSGSQTFRVEAQSQTQNASGQYVFHINDQVYVNPTDRMTLVVDYASWNAWNQTITVSNYARIEGNQTWYNWHHPEEGLRVYTPVQQNRAQRQYEYRAYTRPREDPVAAAERRQREAEALFQRVEAERRAKDEAVGKAQETLLSLLTPEQRKEYQARKHFHIRGSKGTLYRIMHGSSGNVRQVLSEADEGRGLHAFCAHPQMSVDRTTAELAGISAGQLPHEDAMIAQMLQLMVDEDQFLAVANRHW